MSHVISMHRPGDPRQTTVSDLSKVTLCLVVPRFKHNTLVVHARQHNHSAIAALDFLYDVTYEDLIELTNCFQVWAPCIT
jgi:hypothetical protein